jgi:hypothetical protein
VNSSHSNEWGLPMHTMVTENNFFGGDQHRKIEIVHKSTAQNVRNWSRYKIDRSS